MAVFTKLDWHRFDVDAIAAKGGLATIEKERHEACRQWLSRNGYSWDTLDCSQPPDDVVLALRKMLHWEKQFGYAPSASRNLDALRDGFNFDISDEGGMYWSWCA